MTAGTTFTSASSCSSYDVLAHPRVLPLILLTSIRRYRAFDHHRVTFSSTIDTIFHPARIVL